MLFTPFIYRWGPGGGGGQQFLIRGVIPLKIHITFVISNNKFRYIEKSKFEISKVLKLKSKSEKIKFQLFCISYLTFVDILYYVD